MSLTKLSLGGNNQIFLARGCLVSDISDGDWNVGNLFYGVEKAACLSVHMLEKRKLFICLMSYLRLVPGSLDSVEKVQTYPRRMHDKFEYVCPL